MNPLIIKKRKPINNYSCFVLRKEIYGRYLVYGFTVNLKRNKIFQIVFGCGKKNNIKNKN